MEIQREILSNINNRYVLLEKGEDYLIVDKIRRTMVVIDDPLINFSELIKMMIKAGVEVFKNAQDLPLPKEEPIRHKAVPPTYKIFIKRLYDQNAKETGAIISALANKNIDKQEKQKIENLIQKFAFTVLYPNEGLNLFSDIHEDTASITIIKGINNLPSDDIGTERMEIYDW